MYHIHHFGLATVACGSMACAFGICITGLGGCLASGEGTDVALPAKVPTATVGDDSRVPMQSLSPAHLNAVTKAVSEVLSDTSHQYTVSVVDDALILVSIDCDLSQIGPSDTMTGGAAIRRRRAAAYALARRLHSDIYQRSIELAADRAFNAENMLRFEVGGTIPLPDAVAINIEYDLSDPWSEVILQRCSRIALAFWGPRLVSAITPAQMHEDSGGLPVPDHGLLGESTSPSEVISDPALGAPAARVRARIVPLWKRWKVGDGIGYQVHLLNTSHFGVVIPYRSLMEPFFQDVTGRTEQIRHRYATYYRDPNGPGPPPRYVLLAPGESRSFWGSIATDAHMIGDAYVMLAPGRWAVSFPDLRKVCNVQVAGEPSHIEIVRPSP